jgi:hypothetical protein
MPRPSGHQQLLEIIMTFLDEMVEKYTVFEEFNIEATYTSEYGGYIFEAGSGIPNLLLQIFPYNTKMERALYAVHQADSADGLHGEQARAPSATDPQRR